GVWAAPPPGGPAGLAGHRGHRRPRPEGRALHPGWRGGGARRRGPPAALPGADAPLPPGARRGGGRGRDAPLAASLRLPPRRGALAPRRALRAALGSARASDGRTPAGRAV